MAHADVRMPGPTPTHEYGWNRFVDRAELDPDLDLSPVGKVGVYLAHLMTRLSKILRILWVEAGNHLSTRLD
jgi:hypothetical protein